MGTWGTGAFDNDSVADWSWMLDDADGDARIEVVRAALLGASAETGYLDYDVAASAIGAAALVSSQLPGGYEIDPSYGPACVRQGTMPELPADLRDLAVRALDRIVADGSEWRSLWGEGGDTAAFDELDRIRASLTTS